MKENEDFMENVKTTRFIILHVDCVTNLQKMKEVSELFDNVSF